MTHLFISAGSDAIDAAVVTKGSIVNEYLRLNKIDPRQVAAIGDSANDLPLLEVPGLGLVGVPSNAQENLKARVAAMKSGSVMTEPFLAGFLEFYELACRRGIELVFTDRDGVLIWKGPSAPGLRDLLLAVNPPTRPFLIIVTGTSADQNQPFLASNQLDASLGENTFIKRNPEILFAENGAVRVNVLTGERSLPPGAGTFFTGGVGRLFKERVIQALASELLPSLGLQLSNNYSDQVESVYLPPKQAMFTVNIPRYFKDGTDYRRSVAGLAFGRRVREAMTRVAEELAIPFTVVEAPPSLSSAESK